MGFLGESAPPTSCLGVPIGAGTRSPPEFSGSQWPNPKREFLSFGTEKLGTGTAVNPNTEKYMDDLNPVIESIEWRGTADGKMIFEDTTKKIFNLKL